MNGISAQVTKTGKQAAISTAKQMAREPFEILKTTPEQILGTEVKKRDEKGSDNGKSDKGKEQKELEEEKDKLKSQRLSSAYEAELKDIRREEIFKALQEKIQKAEDINVNDFPELTMEQKQVLNALKEVVKSNSQKSEVSDNILPEVSSKRKRGLFSGIRTRVERLKRRGEIRMPPSG